ncbi:MAG TPA: termination factor Rho [Cellvibrio sp.]
MPQRSDSKAKYTDEQKRKAEHIEEGYKEKGVSSAKAEQIAWATVNKQSGGGEKSGSGKHKPEKEKQQARHDSAQRAAETRKAKEKPNSLESQTKVSLLEKARQKNIAGRSGMNKQELILALRRVS